jgi:di/tricarboxylate transporter
VIILIVVALVLYAREDVHFETASLIILIVLTLGFHLFPYATAEQRIDPSDFFLGFGNRGLIAVCVLMILGRGLVRTGALEPVGRALGKLWRRLPTLAMLLMLLLTFGLSSFINDTPVVVLMLPILVGLSLRSGQPPSASLMPMGFATILGGMTTTIGTSTNLLVVNVAADMGMQRFQMFDWAGASLIGGAVGILYLWLIAPRLLPTRQAADTQEVARIYSAQIQIGAGSPVVGKSLADAIARTDKSLRVESIQRGPNSFLNPLPDIRLQPGDRIVTSDTQEQLREHCRLLGGALYSGEHEVDAAHPLSAEGQKIAEIAITPSSRLIGVPITRAYLKQNHELTLLAFKRFEQLEEDRARGLEDVVLKSGDVLLVQGTQQDLANLKTSADFLVLDGSITLPRTRLAPIALATMVSVIIVSALGIAPIEISALVGCLVLILTRCLTWEEAMTALSAKVILIIVASLALGSALLKTGGADYLAQLFVYLSFGASPAAILMGLMILMAVLTNIVSNNAAAVIGTPIAIGIAQLLGMPLEPFVLAVIFGANLSFATPMAYQTHILVMNAAGYKFRDFVKVGLPLTLIVWLTLSGVLIWTYDL